jgi:hypothetical protein
MKRPALTFLLTFIYATQLVFCQEVEIPSPLRIVKVGTSIPKFPELLDLSIMVDLEKQIRNSRRFSINYSVRYEAGPYVFSSVNPGQPPVTVNTGHWHDYMFSYRGKYYPFLLKKKSLNLFFIQAGPTYWHRDINGSTYFQGPGFDYALGAQVIILKKISVSGEMGNNWIINIEDNDYAKNQKYYSTGVGYILKAGFVF